ncbi:MAG: polyphosphate polymerase domain-containing protein [Clostridia bacterium]|nr:polyphosphate polymerase domain-containing protein [Clostridia bacterium]
MAKRYEDKYMCTEGGLLIAMSRASALLDRDRAGENGRYMVRSLYFDGPDSPCAEENEAGTDKRSKYRIRLYNGDTSFIRAEIKRKENGVGEKVSAALDIETVRALMKGSVEPSKLDNPVLREFALKIRGESFRPVIVCEYMREAYVGEPGRMRITADRDLRGSRDVERFLSADLGPAYPVYPLGWGLLEVKYTELLPSWVLRSVVSGSFVRTSFSKYRMCRLDLTAI